MRLRPLLGAALGVVAVAAASLLGRLWDTAAGRTRGAAPETPTAAPQAPAALRTTAPAPRAADPVQAAPHLSSPPSAPPAAPLRRPTAAPAAQSRVAHVVVIGNNGYVDGALVMGASLARHSALARAGEADVVCLATAGKVSRSNLRRLASAGYTQVQEVRSLAAHVPRSSWKDTFDKLYIFNLTQYGRIAYWDADMLAVANPDAVLHTALPSEWWVGAIGGGKHGGRPYFQSGMMVIRPTPALFAALWDTFLSRPGPMDAFTPRNRSRYWNQHHTRDGLLLRNFFGSRFRSVSRRYSHNIGAFEKTEGNVALHYRGGFKPWNNRRNPPRTRRRDARKEFGYGYLAWWREYERLHTERWLGEDWGSAPEGPRTHVWMMRDTSASYRQLLSAEDARRRNLSAPGVRLVPGALNASCDAACAAAGARCHAPSLSYWAVAESCALLQRALGCPRCEPGIRRAAAPGVLPGQGRGGTCVTQLHLDDRFAPSCDARDASVARLCPCATGSPSAPRPWDGNLSALLA